MPARGRWLSPLFAGRSGWPCPGRFFPYGRRVSRPRYSLFQAFFAILSNLFDSTLWIAYNLAIITTHAFLFRTNYQGGHNSVTITPSYLLDSWSPLRCAWNDGYFLLNHLRLRLFPHRGSWPNRSIHQSSASYRLFSSGASGKRYSLQ